MANLGDGYVCKAGADPRNPHRTENAIATIYNPQGISVYHLSSKDASKSVERPGEVKKFLHELGIIDKPEATTYQKGGFRHSQPEFTDTEVRNPHRDPFGLHDRIDRIEARFGEDGKLQGCTVKPRLEGEDIKIMPGEPAVSKPAAALPVRKAEASFDPSPMG